MVGSHSVRRREYDIYGRRSEFWNLLTEEVKAMLHHVSGGEKNVVAFGEIFGSGVQDMAYGLENNHRDWRLFDIAVDGKYLDYDEKIALCEQFGIKIVPLLYRGPYRAAVIDELTDGPTTLCAFGSAGKFKGREGVVIVPTRERFSPELGGYGRVILKSVSADYLARKDGTDSH